MSNPSLWRDTVAGLRFYSRLPLPPLKGEADPHGLPDFSRLARAVPMVGAVLGGLAGLVLVPAAWLWPPFIAALLAVGAAIWMTGAFHEDGLADTADGLGGGSTKERKLEIMKDSRIGTYGGAALIIGILLRVLAIAGLVQATGAGETALALVAAGAVSRTAALSLAVSLPPARSDGAAFAAGAPSLSTWRQARVMALVLGCLAIPAGGIAGLVVAGLAVVGVVAFMTSTARDHVGGQTGDIAGATQQACEVAILLALLIFA